MTNKTIVGVFSSDEIRTGAHKRYLELLNTLHERGYHVVLLAPKMKNERFKFEHITINYDQFRMPRTLGIVFAINRIRKSIKHIDNGSILIFGETNILAGVYLKSLLKIKLVYSMRSSFLEIRRHTIENSTRSNFKKYIKRLNLLMYVLFVKCSYSFIDKMVVQNVDDKNFAIGSLRVQSRKISIIPNNISRDMDSEAEDLFIPEKMNNILFLGSLETHKGPMRLLNAFAELKVTEAANLKLTIVGEGSLKKEIEGYIIQRELSEFVSLTGHVPNPKKYIEATDLLIVPSLFDSFPNTILESLSLNRPVIGSRVGGIKYILHEDLLFEPDSSIAIIEKIKELTNPKRFLEAKKKCRESKEKLIFDWVSEFEKIL